MPRQRIVSYHPIIETKPGWVATERFHIPKFLDGSCRTEPDLLAQYPSISALCRKGKFAPTLNQGDIAVYITVKRPYFDQPPHQRLVAILEVVKRFETHEEAADWYKEQGQKLPRNCMVAGNDPLPLECTAYDETNIWPNGSLQQWDNEYKIRANDYGVFLACKPHYLELHNPPIFSEATMISIFGRVPGTQNPRWFSDEQYQTFKNLFDEWLAENSSNQQLHRVF